ncbi:MAG: hypothetical protein ACE5Z5_08915 [Candidatus Bathyarchaeia archaeon]
MIDEIPLLLRINLNSSPSKLTLEDYWRMLWYQRASKILYAISFVGLGVVGLPMFLKKARREMNFWVAFIMFVTSIGTLFYFTFHFMWLGYYSSLFYFPLYVCFALTPILSSLSFIISMGRRHLPTTFFSGLITAAGWALVIKFMILQGIGWGDPTLHLFMVYPILLALSAAVMASSLDKRPSN